jgi:hypothetical protein
MASRFAPSPVPIADVFALPIYMSTDPSDEVNIKTFQLVLLGGSYFYAVTIFAIAMVEPSREK